MKEKCVECGKPLEDVGICQECWDEGQRKEYYADLMEGMRMPWDVD